MRLSRQVLWGETSLNPKPYLEFGVAKSRKQIMPNKDLALGSMGYSYRVNIGAT